MYCLTREEVRRELAVRELFLPVDDKFCPYFDESDADCFIADLPGRALSLPLLSRALSLLEAEDESQFSGAFLWFDLWDIGSPQLGKIGWAIVEEMRLAYGETRSIEVAPAHRFRGDESTQVQGFLLQALVFQWDANLVYSRRDRFVHISHDGFLLAAGKTKAVRDECWSRLEYLSPRPASDKVRARFCRPHLTAAR